MPNEKHFHGQSHSTGGFDINEATISPDANYWKIGARGAYNALLNIMPTDEAIELVEDFWNSEHTWKEICEGTEKVLSDARAKERDNQAAETADIVDWLDDEVTIPDPKVERQEQLEIARWFGCEFLFEDATQLPHRPDEMSAEFGSAEWYNNIKPIEF